MEYLFKRQRGLELKKNSVLKKELLIKDGESLKMLLVFFMRNLQAL